MKCYETNFYLRTRAIGLSKNNLKNHKYPNSNLVMLISGVSYIFSNVTLSRIGGRSVGCRSNWTTNVVIKLIIWADQVGANCVLTPDTREQILPGYSAAIEPVTSNTETRWPCSSNNNNNKNQVKKKNDRHYFCF